MHQLLLVLMVHMAMADLPRHAQVIAMCESGDTVTLGTYSWTARSKTSDGGAWQFNDATWAWVMPESHVTQANRASPQEQYQAFIKLWDDGKGYRHWSASQACWGKYFEIVDGRAVLKKYPSQNGV